VILLYIDTIENEIPLNSGDVYSSLLNICKEIESNKQYWKKLLKDRTCCEYLEPAVHPLRRLNLSAKETDAHETFTIRFYNHGFFRTIIDWVLNGCQTAAEIIAATLYNAIPHDFTYRME
jgi:hypothetical protein